MSLDVMRNGHVPLRQSENAPMGAFFISETPVCERQAHVESVE
ncbi:MAG: hypothetical protein RL572_1135 [Pseudomonadota bacterium]